MTKEKTDTKKAGTMDGKAEIKRLSGAKIVRMAKLVLMVVE